MVLIVSLLKLPATIFHELSHLVVALLTFSRIRGFTVIPEIEGRRITLGSVRVTPSFKGSLILIGLAPFTLWGIAFYIMYERIIIYNEVITLILSVYLMLGGIPSTQDLKSASDGLFSISGIILIALIILGIYFCFKGEWICLGF